MIYNIVVHYKNGDILKVYNKTLRDSAISYISNFTTNIDKTLYNDFNDIKKYEKSYYMVKELDNKIHVYRTIYGYLYNGLELDSTFIEVKFNTLNDVEVKPINDYKQNIYRLPYYNELIEKIKIKKLKID